MSTPQPPATATGTTPGAAPPARKLPAAAATRRPPVRLDALPRGVWLVKVPKWVAAYWKSQPDGANLGMMYGNAARTEFQVGLPRDAGVPKSLILQRAREKVGNTVLFNDVGKGYATALVGTVTDEATMVPVVNDEYRAMKKRQTEQALVPAHQTKTVEHAELARSKGLAAGAVTTETLFQSKYMKAKPTHDNRRERMPKADLIELLLTLFRGFKYWPMKALKDQTKQPEQFLREVLPTVAMLNKRGPYAGTYSLKPEFKQGSEDNVDLDMGEDGGDPALVAGSSAVDGATAAGEMQ